MEKFKVGQVITIPEGAELDRGPTEDSDVIGELNKPIKAKIVRIVQGALRVEIDGMTPPIFLHMRFESLLQKINP